MSVLSHLEAAFAEAYGRQQEIMEKWILVSFHGPHLPRSKLSHSLQSLGHFDVVLRCLEEEFADGLSKGVEIGFGAHYAGLISTPWISDAYEIFRLSRERNIVEATGDFESILWDLSILRMPLDKHELAGHKRIGKLVFRPEPQQDGDDDEVYDPADPNRSHIMSSGFSHRGSMMWHAYDYKVGGMRWIERRSLSDRILSLWERSTR